MIKFDIALLFDDLFIDELNKREDTIYSVYFGLGGQYGLDARKTPNSNIDSMRESLIKLSPKIKRYITLNGRHATIDNFSESKLQEVGDILSLLAKENLINGILFTDFIYLRALLEINKELSSLIELIPSINCSLDSEQKIKQHIRYINKISPGYIPTKIILDRSLNRDLKRLKLIYSFIKETYPLCQVEILANEGCLLNCPYKINHDNNLSLDSGNLPPWGLYKMSVNGFFPDIRHDLTAEACLQDFENNLAEIIQSPFIRPEDIDKYDEITDIIKISGKLKETKDLLAILHQYEKRESQTNLIKLLDAPFSLNEKYYIRGFDFPKNFLSVIGNCDKDCDNCHYCNKIIELFCHKIEE